MHFSLRSVAGYTENNEDIVKLLFTPIRPWEENFFAGKGAPVPVAEPVVGFQRPDVLKTIRFLKG